jgi:hypothetical protein
MLFPPGGGGGISREEIIGTARAAREASRSAEEAKLQDKVGGLGLLYDVPGTGEASPPKTIASPLGPKPSAATGPTFVSAAQPKTNLQLAREDAMREWQTHQEGLLSGKKLADQGFALSWDFFARHPEISGGTFITPAGEPKFLFHENKPADIMGTLYPVIQRYAEQMARIQSGNLNPDEAGRMFATMPNAEQLTAFSHLMGAQTTAGKAPSEIQRNEALARAQQVFPNLYGGTTPGEMKSLSFDPLSGTWKTIATGQQVEHGQGTAALAMNILTRNAQQKADLFKQTTEVLGGNTTEAIKRLQPIFDFYDEESRKSLNALQTMLGVNRVPGAPGGKMTKAAFTKWMTENNIGITQAQIESQYLKDKTLYPHLLE